MITKRDQDILNFIEEFHAATSSQINRLFFANTSYRYGLKRLHYLYSQGFIHRRRSTINNDYAYYINNKSLLQQLHHDLIRAELYSHINNTFKVLQWNNEAPVSSIRPDALCYIENHGIVFPVLVEVHLNNKFNFDKYKGIDFVNLFGVPPRVLICTDRKVTIQSMQGIKFKVIGFDMAGLDSIL